MFRIYAVIFDRLVAPWADIRGVEPWITEATNMYPRGGNSDPKSHGAVDSKTACDKPRRHDSNPHV